MGIRKRLLVVAIPAVVAVPAYLLLGHLGPTSNHDASPAGSSPESRVAGATAAPATPVADPPAASAIPAGELRLEEWFGDRPSGGGGGGGATRRWLGARNPGQGVPMGALWK